MPFFSIIIPLYNKEHYIENTLKSVLNQSFSDFEILIINDGSTDNSEQKILNFKDYRIHYFSKKNEGVSNARNLGIEKATANFITFLDADDFWYPDFLETIHKGITLFPKEKVFSGAIEIETPKKTFSAQYSIAKKSEYEVVNFFDASYKESIICTSCAVFHRNVFEKVGVFDTSIKSGQDTDLWIRIGLKYPIVFSWKILARYVYDENSLSKNKKYTTSKLNFLKFIEEEKSNPWLKKYLDLNRFSIAIKSKLNNDKATFTTNYQAINLKNLSSKKRFLLILPSFLLKKLIHIKIFIAEIGIGNSVFK